MVVSDPNTVPQTCTKAPPVAVFTMSQVDRSGCLAPTYEETLDLTVKK